MGTVPAVKTPRNEVGEGAGGDGRCQFLTFLAGGEVFAIDILRIKEIIEYGTLTVVPMMPPFIRGVINLRGAVVPVIDLAARFGGAPATAGKRSCIVIIEVVSGQENQDVGIMVDAVNQVLEISPADIAPPPSFGTPVKPEFIGGMGRVEERFVVILEVNRVLCIEEMAASVGDNSGAG